MDIGGWITAFDAIAYELALFAGIGFLIGGLDDLAIDLLYFWRGRRCRPGAATPTPRRFAVLIPAWDEAAVIGEMLDTTLTRLGSADVCLYVGGYRNDVATLGVIATRAARDARVRLVVNAQAGPTTKGDNLNGLWRALLRDEADGEPRFDAVVLHDAEDLVHRDAFQVYAAMLDAHAVVQLPVLPLIARDARWVSGHYADEFAESHIRQSAVRAAIGAGMPLAGVGCAIRRDALDAVAAARPHGPFDAASLTEDYELGLAASAGGVPVCFAQVRDADGEWVATRAYFPETLPAAARQKARWLTGIALVGWDRLGWGNRWSIAEWWMRMRDRRSPIAALVLAAGYAASIVGLLTAGSHLLRGTVPPPLPVAIQWVLIASSSLVLWRLANRMVATGLRYGWREGLRAAPRTVVGNVVALMALHRAARLYAGSLRGEPLRWDKTAHVFPVARPQ